MRVVFREREEVVAVKLVCRCSAVCVSFVMYLGIVIVLVTVTSA